MIFLIGLYIRKNAALFAFFFELLYIFSSAVNCRADSYYANYYSQCAGLENTKPKIIYSFSTATQV